MYEFRQNEEDCLDARYADLNNVYMEKCHEMGGNQKWELREVRCDCEYLSVIFRVLVFASLWKGGGRMGWN